MAVVVIGIPQAIARFAEKAIAGRVAATATTRASAPVVTNALRARAPRKTGALQASIGVVEASEDATSSSVVIGARVAYDRYYQEGTSRQPPRPYTPEVAEVIDSAVATIASTTFRAAIG